MRIKQEIEKLQRQADLVTLANRLLESDIAFKKSICKGIDDSITIIFSDALKVFLNQYIASIEDGVDPAQLLTLSKEEVQTVKFFIEKLENKGIKSKLTQKKFEESFPLKEVKSQAIAQTYDPNNMIFNVADITWITRMYGTQAVPNITPGMKIRINKVIDDDYYEGALLERPDLIFPIPKECVYKE